MSERKAGDIASFMMFVWLVFYILAAFVVPRWADFLSIIGCTVPMLLFKPKVRGKTFGTRDCNTVKYKKKEYVAFFVFCISGCALISALAFLVSKCFGADFGESAARGDFLYLMVFSCMVPAFFEEWLMRGGVLGALAKHGAAGVWMCAMLFMLMHVDIKKWLYALFAGLLITALVYLTECIYLGMLLHFCNNFTSLLLSYLPSGLSEYIALIVIAAIFIVSFLLLQHGTLFTDIVQLLCATDYEKMRGLLTPMFWIFTVAVTSINILLML